MRSLTKSTAQLALLVPLALAACQGPRTADPTVLTDLTATAAALLEGTDLPALSLAVVVDGELVGTGAAGLRRIDSTEPVTAADAFHIGSCTKSMTATVAAILVDEGLLDWGTTIEDVFPGFDFDEAARGVRLDQLLTNTGGMATAVPPALWDELWAEADTPTAMRRRLVEATVAQPLAHPPGTTFEYSNTGFAIAGAMLEQLAGVPFEELLAARLFVPLGLTTAGFRAPATGGQVDQPYGHSVRRGTLAPVEPEPAGDNPRAIAPAGAVHLSAADLARYVRLHLGAQAGLLEPASLARLHTPPEGGSYAMGWFTAQRAWAGGTALTHAGSNTMFYTVIWLAPERGFAAVAMTNMAGAEASAVCDAAVGTLIEDFLGPTE
ncbi:MAG: serine hydrolase [Planctomycetota bacterium]|nr:serine hydrolase [Planctomycetota bacterium]